MSASVFDDSTVVGGPSNSYQNPSFGKDSDPGPSKPTIGAKTEVNLKLVDATDYLQQERPFFVLIGKEGLIAALNELDSQIRKASLP